MRQIDIGTTNRPDNPNRILLSCYCDAPPDSIATFTASRDGLHTETKCSGLWELFRVTIPLSHGSEPSLVEAHCEFEVDKGERRARENFGNRIVALTITEEEWDIFVGSIDLQVVVANDTGDQLGQTHKRIYVTLPELLRPTCRWHNPS